jgi:hypothetical protein
VPEQSTAALIVHHPEAKYYSIKAEGGAEPRGTKPEDRTSTAESRVTSGKSR